MPQFNNLNEINETPDYTNVFDPADVQQNRGMGILAYIGILVLIPLFAAKDSPFARFHSNQGIVLAVAEILATAVLRILSHLKLIGWIFGLLGAVVSVAALVLSILGIVNAAKGRAKELPIIGGIQLIK